MRAKLLGSLMVLAAGMTGPAGATPCRSVIYQQAEVVVPVVQTQVITVAVPTYTLVPYPYQAVAVQPVAPVATAPVAASVDSDLAAVLRELRDEVRGMRAEFRGVAPPAAQQAPKIDTDSAVKAMVKSCAKCHSGTADKDGAGFALFKPDGAFIPVAPRDAKRIAKMVATGQMPPPPMKLDAVEAKAIVDAFKQ